MRDVRMGRGVFLGVVGAGVAGLFVGGRVSHLASPLGAVVPNALRSLVPNGWRIYSVNPPWPTFTPAVDGDDAPIVHVKSRSPSCRLIELSLSAETAPANFVGSASLEPAPVLAVRRRILASTSLPLTRTHAACTRSPAA